jgi:hypothetical protein
MSIRPTETGPQGITNGDEVSGDGQLSAGEWQRAGRRNRFVTGRPRIGGGVGVRLIARLRGSWCVSKVGLPRKQCRPPLLRQPHLTLCRNMFIHMPCHRRN